MALTAQSIIDRARPLVNDPNGDRWSDTEIIHHLSDAQRSAVQVRPDINGKNALLDLVEGTKQSIPSDGHILLDVIRYRGTASNPTEGPAVRQVDRTYLDNIDKNWHSAVRNEGDQIYWTYDLRDRETFYIYPREPNPLGRIEISYAKIPAEVSGPSDALGLSDVYQPALLAYVLFRCFMKDQPLEGETITKVNAYYKQFVDLLNQGLQSEFITLPEQEKERQTE